MQPSQLIDKEYLGDGLYVGSDGYNLRLYTERPDGWHYVGLEPEVLWAFDEYRIRFAEKYKAPQYKPLQKEKDECN